MIKMIQRDPFSKEIDEFIKLKSHFLFEMSQSLSTSVSEFSVQVTVLKNKGDHMNVSHHRFLLN